MFALSRNRVNLKATARKLVVWQLMELFIIQTALEYDCISTLVSLSKFKTVNQSFTSAMSFGCFLSLVQIFPKHWLFYIIKNIWKDFFHLQLTAWSLPHFSKATTDESAHLQCLLQDPKSYTKLNEETGGKLPLCHVVVLVYSTPLGCLSSVALNLPPYSVPPLACWDSRDKVAS